MAKSKIGTITKALEAQISSLSGVVDITAFRQLQMELVRFLERDYLTGAYNRWKIEEVLEEEMRRVAILKRGELAIMLIDIDNFKRTNDTEGHTTGDLLLRMTANYLSKSIERTFSAKYLGRWGGDEFLYVLPYEYIARAESLTVKYPGCMGKCSISTGIAYWKKGDTVTSFIDRADKEMYKNKASKKA